MIEVEYYVRRIVIPLAGVVLTYNFQNTYVQNIHGILHLIRGVLSIDAKFALWVVPIWPGMGK
jgi:hypothetical protein